MGPVRFWPPTAGGFWPVEAGGEYVRMSAELVAVVQPVRGVAPVAMEPDTFWHLFRWLEGRAEDLDPCRAIVRALQDEPDLVDRGLSWPEIVARGQ